MALCRSTAVGAIDNFAVNLTLVCAIRTYGYYRFEFLRSNLRRTQRRGTEFGSPCGALRTWRACWHPRSGGFAGLERFHQLLSVTSCWTRTRARMLKRSGIPASGLSLFVCVQAGLTALMFAMVLRNGMCGFCSARMAGFFCLRPLRLDPFHCF